MASTLNAAQQISAKQVATSMPHGLLNDESVNDDLIGARLLAAGKVTNADIEKALAFQSMQSAQGAQNVHHNLNNRLGAVLLRMGAISEESLLPHLSEQTGIPLLVPAQMPAQQCSTFPRATSRISDGTNAACSASVTCQSSLCRRRNLIA